MSPEQEVSCYGQNGWGDTGDNWRVSLVTVTLTMKIIIASSGTDRRWIRKQKVHFQHVDTGKYLSLTDKTFR
jgi:dolichyl-phosphate-mannose--protein O-mannosyl transferase